MRKKSVYFWGLTYMSQTIDNVKAFLTLRHRKHPRTLYQEKIIFCLLIHTFSAIFNLSDTFYNYATNKTLKNLCSRLRGNFFLSIRTEWKKHRENSSFLYFDCNCKCVQTIDAFITTIIRKDAFI